MTDASPLAMDGAPSSVLPARYGRQLGRTTGGFWVAALVLLTAGLVSISSVRRFAADAEWVARTHQVMEQAQRVLTGAIDVQSGQRGYIITGDETFLEPYKAARATVVADLQRLRRLTSDNPAHQPRVEAIEALISERLAVAHAQIESRRTSGFEPVRVSVVARQGEDLMRKLRSRLSEFVAQEQRLLTERDQRSNTSRRVALGAIAGLGGLAFAILGLTATRIRSEMQGRARAQAHVERLNADLEQHSTELAAEVLVREAARRRNEELKSFAYTVSHDLKAPLRGISGYAQELERRHQEGLTDRAKFCTTQIISAARNLDNLIDDLLRYARLDTEAPTVSEVDLADLVMNLLRDRKHTVAELGVEVKVAILPGSLRVWERGLNQVLSNLIDNAIKYSRDSKPPQVSIQSEASSEGCLISVSDNGIGFDMKYHDRIFGLFNRLVRSNEFEGTGAGLAIVKKLVEKLGGTIRAQAAPGQGATFFLQLQNPDARPAEA